MQLQLQPQCMPYSHAEERNRIGQSSMGGVLSCVWCAYTTMICPYKGSTHKKQMGHVCPQIVGHNQHVLPHCNLMELVAAPCNLTEASCKLPLLGCTCGVPMCTPWSTGAILHVLCNEPRAWGGMMTHATSFGWRKEWEGRQLPECGRPRSFQHPILPCLETDWASRQGTLCSLKRERGCIDVIVGISIYELVPTLC